MESLRSQLAKGLLMVPEFDPAKVANSAFCRNWCIAKVRASPPSRSVDMHALPPLIRAPGSFSA